MNNSTRNRLASTNFVVFSIRFLLILFVLPAFTTTLVGQCPSVFNPASGGYTSQFFTVYRCPADNEPVNGTLSLTFQSPINNVTINWGNGTIQNYPGPVTTQSFSYPDAGIFSIKINAAGCSDTLHGIYVNEPNNTVPGVGFLLPPNDIHPCLPYTMQLTNASPGMNGYSRWELDWGDGKIDTIGSAFNQNYSHTYNRGNRCGNLVKVKYLNACGTIPAFPPAASFGPYTFRDTDTAAVLLSSANYCLQPEIQVVDKSGLNCLGTADTSRYILWTGLSGFSAPLPAPGDNTFRPYGNSLILSIPASNFLPVPSDSIYKIRMILKNSCGMDTADVQMVIFPEMSAPVISQNGSMLTSSAVSGNQWRLNGADIPGANQQSFTPSLSGTYTAVVSNENCTSPPSNPIVFVSVAKNVHEAPPLTIFPNPASTILNFVSTQTNFFRLQLTDLSGHVIRCYEILVKKNTSEILDLRGIPAGFYLISAFSENGTFVRTIQIR